MSKSIFIATPAFGGQISVPYAQASLVTLSYFYKNGIPCMWAFRSNESLINRARNKMAHDFLNSQCSHLLFIDADIGWTEKDLNNLLNHDKGIVGGTYACKMTPITLNFNPVQAELDQYFSSGYKSVEAYRQWQTAKADSNGLIEVMHIPTGFMLIDRKVFETLAPHVAEYKSMELMTGEKGMVKEFFPVRVKNEILESEDWAFCSIAREHGVPVYLQTNIICDHFGSYTYAVK